MEVVILEQMIPENHLLRRIDTAVDFSFIHDLFAPLYCENNRRPAIEPKILFSMLSVGYLYGIKSEASTISQNRIRRFRDNDIAEQIFNNILRQCIAKGLIGGGFSTQTQRISRSKQTNTRRI